MRFYFFEKILYATLLVGCSGIHSIVFGQVSVNAQSDTDRKIQKTQKTFIKFDSEFRVSESELAIFLANKLQLSAPLKLIQIKKIAGNQFTDYKFQVVYRGIPVENKYYFAHVKNGNLVSISGDFNAEVSFLNSTISLSKGEIEKLVIRNEFNSQVGNDYEMKTDLVYFVNHNFAELAYKVDFFFPNMFIHKLSYLKVSDGSVLEELDLIQSEDIVNKVNTKYSGRVPITYRKNGLEYTLEESARGKGIKTYNMGYGINFDSAQVLKSTNMNWPLEGKKDQVALDIHFGSEAFYDYYKEKFNFNSFDNHGDTIKCYFHPWNVTNNAFWDGKHAVFGDGDRYRNSEFTSIEVVGHELTHALIQYTAGLLYKNESGALNESFSDIFGTAIDFYKNPTTANFVIGEQFNLLGDFLRDMANPKVKHSPTVYHGTYWSEGEDDNGGVHKNSSVQNLWFYYLVQGGTGRNELGHNYSVKGIGMDKAAQICFRNLTAYLLPDSKYEDAYFYSIKAAIDLFGECSPEVIAVTDAWYAVGLGDGFNASLKADFFSKTLYQCDNSNKFSFENVSVNAMTYSWYVDGLFKSTERNFTVVLNEEGVHEIKLEVTGVNSCLGSDTFRKKFLVFGQSDKLHSVQACDIPKDKQLDFNIKHVKLRAINHQVEGSWTGNYLDMSCPQQTELSINTTYDLVVQNSKSVWVYAWIDYNYNGELEADELIGKVKSSGTNCVLKVEVPQNAVLFKPLRMRVTVSLSALNSSCLSQEGSKTIDYLVVLSPDAMLQKIGEGISIYPNPFEDKLIVKSDLEDPIERVQLFDFIGNIVFEFTSPAVFQELSLDLPSLAPGAYILRVARNSGASTSVKVQKKVR